MPNRRLFLAVSAVALSLSFYLAASPVVPGAYAEQPGGNANGGSSSGKGAIVGRSSGSRDRSESDQSPGPFNSVTCDTNWVNGACLGDGN